MNNNMLHPYQIVFQGRFKEVSTLDGFRAIRQVDDCVRNIAERAADTVVSQPFGAEWDEAFDAAENYARKGLRMGFLAGLEMLEEQDDFTGTLNG